MNDFYIEQGDLGQFRFRVFGGTFAVDDSLRSLVIASLFTDRRLTAADPRPAHLDAEVDDYQGGFWGDDYPGDAEPAAQVRPHGSLLWTLNRAKQTEETRQLAEVYCSQALQLLVDTGRATDIGVEAWWYRPEMLAISLQITRPDGTVWGDQFTLGIS